MMDIFLIYHHIENAAVLFRTSTQGRQINQDSVVGSCISEKDRAGSIIKKSGDPFGFSTFYNMV